MSPTPVISASPTEPASYTWEATNEEVAARYGIPLAGIVRFDLNTSPTPPALVSRLLAAGRFETPLSEYPPSDYRRLVAAAAARYGVGTDEVLVGAGADEILDIIGKVFLPAGGAAIIPTPSYSMYRVITEQRAARGIAVPRLAATDGYAMDVPAIRSAASATADAIAEDGPAQVVWLCSPNNPTALPEPDGAVEALLTALAGDAAAAGREPPVVVLDEAYAEFTGRSLVELRHRYSNLIVVRTMSKAYALAGLRVGFALARPEMIARLNPVRPPGSVSTVSVTIATEALLDPTLAANNVARVRRERDRLRGALIGLGWRVGRSVTNFLLVDLGSRERAAAVAEGLLSRGLVPRTFPASHPLADHLRLTVRDTEGNQQLISAAREMSKEKP